MIIEKSAKFAVEETGLAIHGKKLSSLIIKINI